MKMSCISSSPSHSKTDPWSVMRAKQHLGKVHASFVTSKSRNLSVIQNGTTSVAPRAI